MKTNKTQIIRTIIQSVFLILGFGIVALIIYTRKVSIHAFCPYAVICFGLNKLWFIRITEAVFAITIVAGFAIFIYTIFYGRKFCGYLCPLGSFQEGLFSYHSRKYRKKHKIMRFYELKLRMGKYLILLITSLMAISGIAYIYMNSCPLVILSRAPIFGILGFLILLFIAVNAFFIDRFFCRWLCPYGALLNIAQHLGRLFRIPRKMLHRNIERCIDCGICMEYCPMNIHLLEQEVVEDVNCIHCHVCDAVCPKQGVLSDERCEDN